MAARRRRAERKEETAESSYYKLIRGAGETRHYGYGGGYGPYQYDAYARAIEPGFAPDYEPEALPARRPRKAPKKAKKPVTRYKYLGATKKGTSVMTYIVLIAIAFATVAAISANAVLADKQNEVNGLREEIRKEGDNIKALKAALYGMYDKDEVEARALGLGMVKPADYKTEHIPGVKQGVVEVYLSEENMTPAEAIRDAINQTGINNPKETGEKKETGAKGE